MKLFALADLGEPFRSVVRDLPDGETIVIRDGDVTVATVVKDPYKLVPVIDEKERERRHKEFIEHLRSRPALNLGPFSRDELYDRD